MTLDQFLEMLAERAVAKVTSMPEILLTEWGGPHPEPNENHIMTLLADDLTVDKLAILRNERTDVYKVPISLSPDFTKIPSSTLTEIPVVTYRQIGHFVRQDLYPGFVVDVCPDATDALKRDMTTDAFRFLHTFWMPSTTG